MALKKTSAKKAAPKKAAVTKAPDHGDAVDEQLARYRSMRNFGVTAEPSGESGKQTSPEALPFCVQKHAASHLHYDFRLGWNGVLKSWAVAKGPSYTVADKRLAVQVEDHPMEYGGFEGIIPAGQYGGGTVMLWDQGTWEPQPGHTDIDAGLRDGSLKFILHGTKLHGKWALIRMGGKAAKERKPNWLLIKEHDQFERPDGPSVTDEEANSVVTGRSIEEIAANKDHVWNSKQTAQGNAWFRQDTQATTPKQTAQTLEPQLKDLPREPQPKFIKPQLAQEALTPPKGAGWLQELKLDGYRMQARKSGKDVQMLTRTGLDWTERMRPIAAAIAKLPINDATLDGEVVVLADDGTTSFADLQAAFQDAAKKPLTYFIFDLLHLAGHNTRDLPLLQRKAFLEELLTSPHSDALHFGGHIVADAATVLSEACKLQAEGIISKRADAPYTSTRSNSWLKLKCLHEQEFVVGGYTKLSNGMRGVGALLLGYYRDGKLIYAGRTGTGFTQKTHRSLADKLEPLTRKNTPFDNPPAEAKQGALWVEPELVVQVRFATWTASSIVRQAAFLGLREDKPAKDVRREAASVAYRPKGSDKPAPKKSASHTPKAAVAAKHNDPLEHPPVRLTHPEKILDTTSGLTKQMLADYYWAIASHMLPHIAGRPLSLVRCPDGADHPCFFQKHVTSMLPPGITSVEVPDKKTGKPEPYITLNTPEALAGLAQIGVLEVHPWGSCNQHLEQADRLIFDLDPDESLKWSTLAEAAEDVRSRLKNIGLESFLKTTGGKGLHVVAPIEPDLAWPTIKQFAHAFVTAMEKANPALYLTKMTKVARTGKIYLDYLRNERGATAVAPYSPRARAGAAVSMPLAWSELNSDQRPVYRVVDFTDWEPRLAKDPWKKLADTKQKITAEALSTFNIKPA